MRKAADAFRSIGEVSQLVGVPPHVLRYWETQFPQLAPVKRADGRRYYRPEDLHLAAGLCELLREEGMTTRGAARMIARDKGAALRARGLARLPERFRSEAEAPAADDPMQAAEPAGVPTVLPSEPHDSSEALATTATAPRPEVAPQGREGAVDAADPEPGGSNPAAQDEPGTPVTAASEGTRTMTTPEGEATAPAAAAPREAAAEPPASQAAPAEAGAEAASPRQAAPEAPTAEAAPAPVFRTEAPAAEATALAASPPEAAGPEAEGQAEASPAPSGGEAAQAAVPARHPAPAAADLPLFPGLAPAAPPPGIWLPRLASAADALRTMTPPRRPPAQMQWLRDRLAALVHSGA